MPDFSGAWDADEVASFCHSVTIPIRIATRRPDGSLWVVPLWYRYRDGVFECATAADAKVVSFLRSTPTVGLDISTNEPPYRGVRGSATASIRQDGGTELLRTLVERYLGTTETPLGQWLLDADRKEVRLCIEPSELYSWDFSARMGAASE
jgi:nitroimidazol reductase NimA-like FMN-containing flavoprotein (pyridoxamine 5'-phosphate oxidase superfamily)